MAVKTIRIPDELLSCYEAMDPHDPLKAIVKQLERFKHISAGDRAVILPNEVRQDLERVYGRPIEDFDRFAAWVRGLATLRVGEADVILSAGQKKAIAHEATAQGMTVTSFLAREIPEMLAHRWGY